MNIGEDQRASGERRNVCCLRACVVNGDCAIVILDRLCYGSVFWVRNRVFISWWNILYSPAKPCLFTYGYIMVFESCICRTQPQVQMKLSDQPPRPTAVASVMVICGPDPWSNSLVCIVADGEVLLGLHEVCQTSCTWSLPFYYVFNCEYPKSKENGSLIGSLSFLQKRVFEIKDGENVLGRVETLASAIH